MSNVEAIRGLEQATAITKACAAAGVDDPAEIPALVAFAKSAEQFATAHMAHERARRAYEGFIATHGADDPGQDFYVAQLSAARDVYQLASLEHTTALFAWRQSRGLESMPRAA